MHRWLVPIVVLLAGCGGAAEVRVEAPNGAHAGVRYVVRDRQLLGAEGHHSARHSRVIENVELVVSPDGRVAGTVVQRWEVSVVRCPDMGDSHPTMQACVQGGADTETRT